MAVGSADDESVGTLVCVGTGDGSSVSYSLERAVEDGHLEALALGVAVLDVDLQERAGLLADAVEEGLLVATGGAAAGLAVGGDRDARRSWATPNESYWNLTVRAVSLSLRTVTLRLAASPLSVKTMALRTSSDRRWC